jgi:flagellar protein FlbT
MSLKINLKPNEKMIIGGAVIKNGDKSSILFIENNVPILREKDIMKQEDAKTFCKGIYFIVQLMYIDNKHILEYHNTYWNLVRDLVATVPRTVGIIDQISQNILKEDYYQALKLSKKLLEFEKEALSHARNTTGSI